METSAFTNVSLNNEKMELWNTFPYFAYSFLFYGDDFKPFGYFLSLNKFLPANPHSYAYSTGFMAR